MSYVKRILILTADAGFGHRSAANAIEEALLELYGEQCTVAIVNPLEDRRVLPFLRDSQSDYDKIVREMPQLYKLGYEASDTTVPKTVVESALTIMLFEVMFDYVRRYRPDAIVTTFPLYQAPLTTVYAIRRHYIPLLTVITDLSMVHRFWFNSAVDFCLVPTRDVELQAMEQGLAPERVKITGIPVRPALARENRPKAEIRAELGWDPNLTTLLVVGSRRVEHLPDVLRAINHSGFPVQLALVAGGDEDLYRQLKSITWHHPAHLYSFVNNMPTLMKASDCLVSKAGGLIVTESLAAGLPLLLIDALPGQEIGNAEYVMRGEAGTFVSGPLEVLETLSHWLDHNGKLLIEHADHARDLGRPRAAYDIANRIWAAAHQEPQSKRRTRTRTVRLREDAEWKPKRPKMSARFSATAMDYWRRGPERVWRQLNDLELAQLMGMTLPHRHKEESEEESEE